MISVLTTIFAGVHGYFQQLDAKKSQLHTVLSQLNALSLQAAEMSFKYPAQPHALGSNFSAQNTVLADQAYSLVTSLGKSASATDINLVALALERNGNAALARRLLAGAVPRIADVLQYQTVHRHLGILSAVLGDQAGVDDEFKKAEGVFDAFPQDSGDPNLVFRTQFYNEMQWAQSLARIDCKLAAPHMEAARKVLDEREKSVLGKYDQMRNQLNE